MIVNRFKNILFFTSAFLLYPFLALAFRMRQRKSKDSHHALRVLIFPQLTRVGDLVCVTPVFRAIKKAYPDSFIGVVVNKKTVGIIKNNPYIDEIVVYRSNDLLGFLRRLCALRFSWSISFLEAPFSTLSAIYALIQNRIKIVRENRGKSEWLTDWFNNGRFLYRSHTDPIRTYLRMLSVLGINTTDAQKQVYTSQRGEQRAEEFLKQQGVMAGETVVGISITAGNKIKEWGDDRFLELARRMCEQYPVKIIFIGAPEDEARISALAETVNDPKVRAATDFSLEELPSLIKRLSLYIAVDTGPIHIADALSVPFIDIVGPVDPRELPPKSSHGILVVPPPGIPPSVFAFKKSGPPVLQRQALDAISVDTVMEAVEKLLRPGN